MLTILAGHFRAGKYAVPHSRQYFVVSGRAGSIIAVRARDAQISPRDPNMVASCATGGVDEKPTLPTAATL
jgi:hypothetical protein